MASTHTYTCDWKGCGKQLTFDERDELKVRHAFGRQTTSLAYVKRPRDIKADLCREHTREAAELLRNVLNPS